VPVDCAPTFQHSFKPPLLLEPCYFIHLDVNIFHLGMESCRFLTFIRRAEEVHFDIDEYLNRIIPPSQLHRLPRPISRFLGFRKNPKPDVGNVLIAFWALIGAFGGLVLVAAIFKYSPVIREYNPPVVFASLVCPPACI
jgi:hypothetical protein